MSIGEAYDRVHASRRSRRDDDDDEDEDEDDDDDEDEDEDGRRPLSRGVSPGRGGQTASSVALKEILKKKVTTVINSRPPGLPTSDPHDAAANAVFLSKFRTFMSWKKENILKCCASGDEMKLKKALVEQGWQALRQHLIDNTADPGLTFTRSSKSGRDKAAVLPLSNGEVAAFHETALTEYLRTSSGDSGSKYTNEEAVNKFLDAFALRFAPVVETFIAAQAAYLAQRRSDHVDFAAGVAAWKRNKLAINKVAAREHEGVAVRDMEPGFLEFLTFMDDINLFRAAVLTYHIKTFEEFEEFEQRGVFQEYKKGMSRDIAFKPARIARIANQTRKTPRVSANSGTVSGGAGGLSDFGSKQTTSASTYPRWGVQVSVAITGESGKRYLRRHSPATKAARDSRLCKGTCVRCKKSWAPGHKCVPSNVVCPYCDEVVGTSKEPNDHYHPWSECHRRLADGGSSDDVFPVQRPYGGGRGGHAGRGRGRGDRGRGRGRGGRSSSWQGDRRGGHAGGGAVSTSSAETVATENPFMGMFVGPARVVDVTTASFDSLTDFYVPVGPCFYVTLELYGGEKVNALVDTGAQHSMITWHCAAKLRDIEAQVGAFQINDVNSGSTNGTLGIVMSVKLTPLGSQAQTRAAEDSIAPAMKLQALVAAKTVKGFGSASADMVLGTETLVRKTLPTGAKAAFGRFVLEQDPSNPDSVRLSVTIVSDTSGKREVYVWPVHDVGESHHLQFRSAKQSDIPGDWALTIADATIPVDQVDCDLRFSTYRSASGSPSTSTPPESLLPAFGASASATADTRPDNSASDGPTTPSASGDDGDGDGGDDDSDGDGGSPTPSSQGGGDGEHKADVCDDGEVGPSPKSDARVRFSGVDVCDDGEVILSAESGSQVQRSGGRLSPGSSAAAFHDSKWSHRDAEALERLQLSVADVKAMAASVRRDMHEGKGYVDELRDVAALARPRALRSGRRVAQEAAIAVAEVLTHRIIPTERLRQVDALVASATDLLREDDVEERSSFPPSPSGVLNMLPASATWEDIGSQPALGEYDEYSPVIHRVADDEVYVHDVSTFDAIDSIESRAAAEIDAAATRLSEVVVRETSAAESAIGAPPRPRHLGGRQRGRQRRAERLREERSQLTSEAQKARSRLETDERLRVRIAQLELMSSSPTRADKMAQIEGGPHGAVRAAIMRNPSVRRTVASILDGTAISRYAVDAANAIGAAAAIAINNDARGHVLHDGKRVTASDFQPKVWEFDADVCESVSTCNPPSIRGPVDPPGQESEGSSYPSLGSIFQ